ncbi:MAG TPA: potassium channel family protein [Candidatus Anammoximicrobium sp.]|nr:potassium channel family protein [Candidatus Anammoximicrobium sp.]
MTDGLEQHQIRRQLKIDLWMTALALVSISIGLYELGQPEREAGMTPLDWLDLSIVAVFILEFALAVRRQGLREVLRRRWWEIPSLIPLTGGMIASMNGIAVVRGVRLLRLVRVVRLLRVFSVALRFRRVAGFIVRVYQRSQAGALFGAAAIIVLLGSVSAYAAESQSNSRFAAFQDAVWWALNMFTNVAYVDFQPVTGLGRIVAGVLQILGIAFIGIFAGSMANAIMQESPRDESEESSKESESKDE